MNEKSVGAQAFYRVVEAVAAGHDSVESLPTTAGPWTPDAQHGGPPAALLVRAIEAVASTPDRFVARFTMELLGPVPVGPLRTAARVLRGGRSVELVEAELVDQVADRPVARARAWLLPDSTDGPPRGSAGQVPLPHGPDDGVRRPRPEHWHPGYLDAVDWRWLSGGLEEPGPGVVWMRPPPLVEGEPTSPVAGLLACVDSASGVSAELDVRDWAFLNTELSVHLLRPPVGPWVCVDAQTTLGPGSAALAESRVHDRHGLVGRSAQALLVVKRA